MNPGHAISTLGAGAAVVGATLLPWVRLPALDTTATGVAAGASGQIVLGLAALALVTAGAGLLWRRGAARLGRANRLLGALLLAWLAAAWATRSGALGADAGGLAVEVGAGLTLALAGSLATFVGAWWATRVRPERPRWRWRATVLQGRTRLSEHALAEHGAWRAPGLGGAASVHLDRLGGAVLDLDPAATRAVSVCGRPAPLDDACSCPDRQHVALGPEDWGLVELRDRSLFLHRTPTDPPRGAAGLVRDELVAAAAMAALVLQVGLLANAALAAAPAMEAAPQDTLGLEQMGRPWQPGPREDLAWRVEGPITPERLRAIGAWLEQGWSALEHSPALPLPRPRPARVREAEVAAGKAPADGPAGHGLARLLSDAAVVGPAGIARLLEGREVDHRIAQAMDGATSAVASGPEVGFVANATASRRLERPEGALTGAPPAAGAARLAPHVAQRVRAVALPGRPTTVGSCPTDAIRRVLSRRSDALRACYERRLVRRPELTGKVTLRWTLRHDGRVQAPTILRSTVRDAPLEQCLRRAVGRLRFAAPPSNVCVVEWPFAFTRIETAAR